MSQRLAKAFERRAIRPMFHLYNYLFFNSSQPTIKSELPELEEIRRKAIKSTDINDHLETLFVESISLKPKLIVELGVRGGESTFVFERVAKLCDSRLVSVDISPTCYVPQYERSEFIQSDDIPFAKEFPNYCAEKKVDPRIDVLFIDTSHEYQHTVEEIRAWFPYLVENSIVFFHDTNAGKYCFKKDGKIYPKIKRDPHRNVIRAIEEYLGTTIDEKQEFAAYHKGFLVKHYPFCYGMTLLKKIKLQ